MDINNFILVSVCPPSPVCLLCAKCYFLTFHASNEMTPLKTEMTLDELQNTDEMS